MFRQVLAAKDKPLKQILLWKRMVGEISATGYCYGSQVHTVSKDIEEGSSIRWHYCHFGLDNLSTLPAIQILLLYEEPSLLYHLQEVVHIVWELHTLDFAHYLIAIKINKDHVQQ